MMESAKASRDVAGTLLVSPLGARAQMSLSE
jgi:hypothetical protein